MFEPYYLLILFDFPWPLKKSILAYSWSAYESIFQLPFKSSNPSINRDLYVFIGVYLKKINNLISEYNSKLHINFPLHIQNYIADYYFPEK